MNKSSGWQKTAGILSKYNPAGLESSENIYYIFKYLRMYDDTCQEFSNLDIYIYHIYI